MDSAILEIDPLALDREWLDQSGKYFYWAEKASASRAESDKVRFQLEKLEAELAIAIRKNPGRHGLDKVTESAINQLIKVHPKFEKLSLELIDARKEAEDLARFVSALEQRRKALENLCFLQSQSYHAQPQDKPVQARRAERKERGVKRTKQ